MGGDYTKIFQFFSRTFKRNLRLRSQTRTKKGAGKCGIRFGGHAINALPDDRW